MARAYCGFQFFFSLLFWIPVFYEYQRRIGLSDAQIFQIQSWYYIAFCLFEIPTGYFADRFGYLKSMRWGAGVLFVSNLLPVFFESYAGFLVHFFLIALSRSLISGASSAYLYEQLKTAGRAQDFQRIEGRARAWSLVGRVLGWALIGSLMQWWLPMPYVLTAVSAAVAVVIAVLLPELRSARVTAGLEARPANERLQWRSLWSLPLILVVTQGIGAFVLSRIGQVNLFQPILSEKGFSLVANGWIMAAMTLAEAAGSMRMSQGDRFGYSVFWTVVLAASLGAMAWIGPEGTVVAFLVMSFAAGAQYPVQRQLMNEVIPNSGARATLLSAESIVDRAVCAIVNSWMGVWIAGGRLSEVLWVSAAAVILLNFALYVMNRSMNRPAKAAWIEPGARSAAST